MEKSDFSNAYDIHYGIFSKLTRHKPVLWINSDFMDTKHKIKMQQIGRHKPLKLHDADDQ